MKHAIFIFSVIAGFSAFAEVPVCPNMPSTSAVKEDEVCKVTSITGPLAEEKYRTLEAPEVAPRPNTFPPDYLTKAIIFAKYSENLICWKIQAPKYRMEGDQKIYMGPGDCAQFSCNIIEHKQQ